MRKALTYGLYALELCCALGLLNAVVSILTGWP